MNHAPLMQTAQRPSAVTASWTYVVFSRARGSIEGTCKAAMHTTIENESKCYLGHRSVGAQHKADKLARRQQLGCRVRTGRRSQEGGAF
jgi:hypothetical protein